MIKAITDDDIARAIGNRAIKHLREMYPHVDKHLYASCRLSMRNIIRNDVNALIKAMRCDLRSQDTVAYLFQSAENEDPKP